MAEKSRGAVRQMAADFSLTVTYARTLPAPHALRSTQQPRYSAFYKVQRDASPYLPLFHQCIVPSTDLIYSCGVVLVLWRRSLQTYPILHTKVESGAAEEK
jgi:hypothetical protein